MLSLAIGLDGVDSDAEDLLQWLRTSQRRPDYEVRGHSTDEGQLGGADTVIATISAVIGAASLVVAIAAWLDTKSKRRRPTISFEVAGHRVVIEDPNEDTIRWLEDRLRETGDDVDPRP